MPPSYTLSVPGQLFVFNKANNVCMRAWERVNRELTRRFIQWSTLAAHLDASKQAVAHWKGRGIPSKYFSQIDAYLEKPLGWTEMGDEVEGMLPTRQTHTNLSLLGTPIKEIPLTGNPDYPAIRKVKFKLSAGASGFGVEYEGEDHSPIVFAKYWYEVNRYRPEALFAVRVANGSMEPGLHDGDIVVVNTLSIQPLDGHVFAVNYEGEMVIKRLIRDDGDWWLHSDNPDQVRYKRKRMHADCFLIGEVVQKQSMRI